ncbi:glycosyltransferase family 39 protein [soil metagenome]
MTSRRSLAPAIGVGSAVALMALAILVPWMLGQSVHVRSFPPLHAEWAPRLGPGTIPAVILAVLAIRFARDAAARAPWRWLLLGSFTVALAWLLSLATVDGLDGIGHILDTQYEYLRTARGVTDFGATLQEYVSRIPLDSVDNWPVHIAGHPPGALLFFVVLVRLGLGSGLAAGFVVIVIAATTPVAVILTVRRLGAETLARSAAPFLVMGPAAIWMAVSADAVFGAVAAWGLCCLAFAATSSTRRALAAWGCSAGLLLGYCVMLSYGLPLLGILALGVLLVARQWRPLPWVAGAAALVVLAFALAGFRWWEAYPVLVERYWDGIASRRQYSYWVWGDLAALAFSAGPLLGASLVAAVRDAKPLRTVLQRPVVVLTLAALATILVADLSGMSKAEVERIWLPFVPWLLLGAGLLGPRERRLGFALQVVFALVVQHLLFTGW